MKRFGLLFLLMFPLFLSAHLSQGTGKVSEKPHEQITPHAGPRVEAGIDVFMTADFIYWTGRMDGLAYVASGQGNNQTSVSRGRVCSPDWEWDPGFKVGLGHNLPHDGWDIYAEYTWFHSTATDSKKGNTLDPNWNISNIEAIVSPTVLASGFIDRASSHWHLHYNVIDLELGRNYFVSQYLSLRPFFGFKTTWQDIDYRVRYHSSIQSGLESNFRMRNDADFWGIGLRTGLDMTWHISPVFSVYGNMALSALWCQYDIKRRDTRTDAQGVSPTPGPPLGTQIITYDTQKDFHTLKGVLELSIGIRGEWWFSDNRYHFLVQTGWEEHVWINHNQLIKTHFVASAHGDMILQGFTLKIRFGF